MAKEIRQGSQTPSRFYVLPYENTRGNEAITLYNTTGRTAKPWQELLLSDIMAYNDEELWVHTKYGYSVPRRNGKNEVVVMRELYGLSQGEHILHTAHRTTTTHSAWERLYDLVERAKLPVHSSYRAFGKEHIELVNGGKIEFRTRTSKGGLGEGFDLLIIDEAQEYQDDQESALKYVVSDSMNPQTIFCGTPPTPVSSGTVFMKFRDNALLGKIKNSGWAEWSVSEKKDPQDKEAWYVANPSLGTILTERKIEDEIGTDDIDFNIQRLGWWIRYNQKSAISEKEWDKLLVDNIPGLKGKLFAGIKYGKDGTNVALSIAVKTKDSKIFVESIDCRTIRQGNKWILDFLEKANIQKVVIDGIQGEVLVDDMKKRKLKRPIRPTVKDVVVANSLFEKGIFDETIAHKGQPSLRAVITNCEHRAIGTNGGFGYLSTIPELDIVLMESVALAYWSCQNFRERRKQNISY